MKFTFNSRLHASHMDVQRCSRCHDELTDPASRERGVGPICAKKDTHLYAKTIPANYGAVTATLMGIDKTSLHPAVLEVFEDVCSEVFKKAAKATQATEATGMGMLSLSGQDCREIAKAIDWMLSYPTMFHAKELLISVVRHLGYAGLAGVLSGKASTGESKVTFNKDAGRLELQGSANKAGFSLFRRVPGVTLPRYRGDKRPYTVPASEHEAFKAIVTECWPCFTDDLEALCAEAAAWAVANPPPPPVVPAPLASLVTPCTGKPVATLRLRSSDMLVTFPWVRGTTDKVVAGLKAAVKPKDRSYNPGDRAWTVALVHKDAVKNLLAQTYDVSEVQTGELTPSKPKFRPAGSIRYGYWSRRTWR